MNSEFDSEMNELSTSLRQLRWRLRLQRLVHFIEVGLWPALALGLGLLVLGRWLPVPNLYLWALTPLAALLALVLLAAVVQPIPLQEVARRTDLELGLKDRVSTALWLAEEDRRMESNFAGELIDRQHKDAAQSLRTENLRQAFTVQLDRRKMGAAVAIILAGLVLAAIPNAMDRILAQQQVVAEEAERIAESLEALADELTQESDSSNEDLEAALEELQALTEALRENPGDLEDALAAISDLEQDLSQRIGENYDQRQAAMDALAAQLESLARSEGLSQEAASDPATALEELTQTLPDDPQALAQSLSSAAAAAAQSGDADLAQALAQLASALQSGDQAAVQQAGEQAGETLSNSQQALSAQAAQQQIEAALQSARAQLTQRVAQAGAGQGQGQGDGQGEGEGEGQGQGQSDGQGQGQGQGQPGGGGGTTADSLPGANSSGQADDPEGEGQSAGTGELDGGDGQPWSGEATSDEMIYVPGQDTGQGEINVQEMDDEQPGESSAAIVPYQSVFPSYLRSTLSALQGSLVPPGLENYIRSYFSLLEP